tara:strand:+ start:42 stop:1976 length:1935 start_codon:yes stop_codon:yes gene_type:complete
VGFKAPLAYSSSFYFVCRKDGIERKYMMYEGEDTNSIDLLHEAPTDQRNGVKVIIPVKYYDKVDFYKKINEQLAYFDSVYFNVNGVDNNFTIYRHEHFQFSPLSSDNKLHICLDNVYYPLDFSKLDIKFINFPVALRFGLSDGLFPTPNRESIRYTKESKETILNKLELVANFFVEKYNETVNETSDIKSVMDYYKTSHRPYIMSSGASVETSYLSPHATISYAQPKVEGIELLDMRHISVNVGTRMLAEYESKYSLRGGKFSERRSRWHTIVLNEALDEQYWVFSDKISGNKKEYIKSIVNNKQWYFLKKTHPFKLGNKLSNSYDNYYNILNLGKYPKNQWRQLITEFQKVMDFYTSKFKSVDNLVVPQEWLDARKKKRIKMVNGNVVTTTKRVKLKGEMVCKEASSLERYVDGKNCKFVSKIYDMATIHKTPYLIVYGGAEHASKIDKFYKAFDKSNVRFITLSERELKVISPLNIHNLISFEKFMERKCKPFRRLSTAALINKLLNDYSSVFRKREMLQSISKDLFDKLTLLTMYHDKNYSSYLNNGHRDAIIEAAQENNLFDNEIIGDVRAIEDLLTKCDFIEAILDRTSYSVNEAMIKVLVDMFKYYKKRIDWKNYKITLNDDVVEQSVTEEEIEELIN